MRLKELRKAKGLTLQKIAQWRQPLSDWVIRLADKITLSF